MRTILPPSLEHLQTPIAVNKIKLQTTAIGLRDPNIASNFEMPAKLAPAIAVSNVPVDDVLAVRAVPSLKRDPTVQVWQ